MKNLLESLKEYTIIVADTGDFNAMRIFRPTDATTNPSLILKAVQQEDYKHILQETVSAHKHAPSAMITDEILVRFGLEILKYIPGRVSTEVDARLSFDTQATIERAVGIIQRYEAKGINKERILIKIAGTWEGIQAAQALESQGIRCNITLLFCLEQAIIAAQAGAKLISPFVGRIYDWYKKQLGDRWDDASYTGINDPGVKSVTQIFNYYKQHGIHTEIMGASFRNSGQILALSGCDLLTISPDLLKVLETTHGTVVQQLNQKTLTPIPKQTFSEAEFRFALNENTMASEKLAEGIRAFVSDAKKLDLLIEQAR